MDKNQIEIDAIIARFFEAFTNANGQKPNVEGMRDYFLPEGIIINNTLGINDIYKLEDFIQSRIKILSSGSLKEFSEREVTSKTEINNTIAQRYSRYEKSGQKNEQAFYLKGIKHFQFVNTEKGWKIAAVTWTDNA